MLSQNPCTGNAESGKPSLTYTPVPSKSRHTLLIRSFCHLQREHCILLKQLTFKECLLFVADMKKRGSRPEKKGKINWGGYGGWVHFPRLLPFAFSRHYVCYNQPVLCSSYPDTPHSLHLFSTDFLKISKSCRRKEKFY